MAKEVELSQWLGRTSQLLMNLKLNEQPCYDTPPGKVCDDMSMPTMWFTPLRSRGRNGAWVD